MDQIPWESQLISYFDQLTKEAPSIQRASRFIMANKGEATKIVSLWYEEFRSSTDRHLVLFYLANDVVQLARSKKAQNFIDLFARVLPYAISRIATTKRITDKTERIINLWRRRSIFQENQIDHFTRSLRLEDKDVQTRINDGSDLPKDLLSVHGSLMVSSYEKVTEDSATIDLDKNITKLLKSTDISKKIILFETIAESFGFPQLGAATLGEEKVSRMLVKLEEDEAIGVERAMEMSRIERLYAEFCKVKNEQSRPSKRKRNETTGDTENPDSRFLYTVTKDPLSVNLLELKALSLEQNKHIEVARQRHEQLLESLTTVQELFETDISSLDSSREAQSLRQTSLVNAKKAQSLLLHELNKKLGVEFAKMRQEKKQNLNAALDNLNSRLHEKSEGSSPPVTNGWATFMK